MQFELKELTNYFYQAIDKAVGDAYPTVKAAGPAVMHLRVAVTDAVPSKPEESVVTLVIRFSWVADARWRIHDTRQLLSHNLKCCPQGF